MGYDSRALNADELGISDVPSEAGANSGIGGYVVAVGGAINPMTPAGSAIGETSPIGAGGGIAENGSLNGSGGATAALSDGTTNPMGGGSPNDGGSPNGGGSPNDGGSPNSPNGGGSPNDGGASVGIGGNVNANSGTTGVVGGANSRGGGASSPTTGSSAIASGGAAAGSNGGAVALSAGAGAINGGSAAQAGVLPGGAGGIVGDGGASTAGTSSTGGVAATPYCTALPYLAAAPTLDGAIENGLTLQFVVPVGWQNTTTPLPAGNELRYAAAWRPNGLYFLLDVTDPNRNPAPPGIGEYGGDSVEIYVDHDAVFTTSPPYFDATGTRQFMIAAPPNDTQPATSASIRYPSKRGTSFVSWSASRWVSVPTSYGYVVETLISAVDLSLTSWSLAAGQQVGFDVAHNVSVAPGETGVDGNRLSEYFLKILSPPGGTDRDYPYTNESVFCSAMLLGQ